MQTERVGQRPVLSCCKMNRAGPGARWPLWELSRRKGRGKGMVSGPHAGITVMAEVFPWHSQSHRVVGSEPILGEDKNVTSVQISKAWGQKLPD